MKNPVIILGANAIGREAKENFEKNGVTVYGFLDEDKSLQGKEIDNVTVLGSFEDDELFMLIGKSCEAFVAVDDFKLRQSLVKQIQEDRKAQPVNAVHSQAAISSQAAIGHGNFINAGTHIAPGADIAHQCIIQAKVYIGPEARIGSFVQIGAGAIINAGALIEDNVFIGSGANIISGVTVGKGARIGAGSVVITPVKAGETVFGNPAQPVKN